MGRSSKMIIAALATAMVAMLGVAGPADARPVDTQRNMTGGGGWCC
jgi:hypothetical protein